MWGCDQHIPVTYLGMAIKSRRGSENSISYNVSRKILSHIDVLYLMYCKVDQPQYDVTVVRQRALQIASTKLFIQHQVKGPNLLLILIVQIFSSFHIFVSCNAPRYMFKNLCRHVVIYLVCMSSIF